MKTNLKAYATVGLLLAGVAAVTTPLLISTSFPSAGSIEKLDPAFDALVPAGAKIEKLADDCKWTEGPIWIHSGYLLFADIPGNRIMKWTPDGKLSVFMHPSGYTGKEKFTGPESGSNGMTLDRRGRLTVAGHAARNVYRLESLAKGATMTILAERYQGKRFNSPNDVVYRADGSLYFTDPPYGLQSQEDNDPAKELPFNGVFRIPGATAHPAGAPPDDSKLQLLIQDMTRPNGIVFSPDQKILYVNSSDPKGKIWRRYDVNPDGGVANGKLFYDATSSPEDGSPDGMKVDQKGNIYSAGPGGVWVFSPAGRHLGTIKPGEKVANCNWGDDGKTLYITASTSLYRIRLKVPGVRP